MKFVEKASGWLFAIGLAVALVLMFNYLDVLILMGFRNSGIDTRVYKGIYTTVAAVANIVVFALFFIICKKIKRPVLQMNKLGWVEILLAVIIAIGMLGFVDTFIMVSDRIAEYIKSLSEQMEQYRQSVNRFTGVDENAVPLWDTVLYLITLCFIVPVEEELIFRGALFGVLRRKMSPFFAMAITAVIFGIMHRVSVHTAYAIICGMILTACYYYTENIITSMIMHSIFNLIGSGVGELLKIKELGVPKTVRSEVILNFNIVCILMMVPAGLALLALARISRKRRLKKAESVTAVE
ncbi:MAG: CPBP family intramembrane metalloprotease [Clostridiales bacterium]|nr:CPBP family intramembrane metalloprotease [Clostridiales bacterium]MBR6487673.1 CPBP family intramembrane metalloprotease [Clostridiales bacterium]